MRAARVVAVLADADAAGWVHVRNMATGECLAVPRASATPGTGLITWPCGDWPDHWWTFENRGGNLRKLRPQHDYSLCAAIPGGSSKLELQVIQWPCGYWADLTGQPTAAAGQSR
jgi:hypothetical protein